MGDFPPIGSILATRLADTATWGGPYLFLAGTNDANDGLREFMTRQLLITLLFAVPLAGCTVFQNASRTLVGEPGEFHWKRDQVRSRQLYLRWADEAWRSSGRAEAACEVPAYRAGYRAGFADFVFGGGNGEPPAVPPREFWNAEERNEAGQRLADLWFAGYRHGVATARAGGYRELVVVRSSLLTSGAISREATATDAIGWGDIETLPKPLKVDSTRQDE